MREVKLEYKDGTLYATLLCEIDHHTAKGARESIDEGVRHHRPSVLVIDFSSVGFMDSSGIGLVMGRVSLAQSIGARVRVVGLSRRLYCLMMMSGVNRLEHLTLECAVAQGK